MRSRLGAARTILFVGTISTRPSKLLHLVLTFLKVYGARLRFFVYARTITRYHHLSSDYQSIFTFSPITKNKKLKQIMELFPLLHLT